MPTLRLTCAFVLFAASSLGAQADTITEKRVREAVTWLAADARGGRDTGSVELAAAAKWIADRFHAAGLTPVREGVWTHTFTLAGSTIDSRAVSVTLQQRVGDETKSVPLEADRDVRQWTVSDVRSGEDEPCTVAMADDPVLQRLLDTSSARRPIVIEVSEEHPFWRSAAGAHQVIAPRRKAARPVFLIRQGVLPANPADGREAVWSATWTVGAAEPAEVAQENVLALLPGTDKRDEYVVVSAHYDHVGRGRAVDGDGIYNGADDNATGTTAVILLAEAMAKMPPPARSVLFVCFAAEERGLRGSQAFCEQPPVPLEHIVANLNIEMIGRPEPDQTGKAWITGHDLSDFATIAAAALARADVELVDFPLAARLFAASDNYSFARRGIVAHSVSAGSLHADYHQPGDEVQKLDLPHMTRIVRALLEVTLEFANRKEAPRWNEKGQKAVDRARR